MRGEVLRFFFWGDASPHQRAVRPIASFFRFSQSIGAAQGRARRIACADVLW